MFLNLEEGSGEILTREELKKVLGGSYYGSGGENSCQGVSREKCKGACESEGYIGNCMWVTAWDKCACAISPTGS